MYLKHFRNTKMFVGYFKNSKWPFFAFVYLQASFVMRIPQAIVIYCTKLCKTRDIIQYKSGNI